MVKNAEELKKLVNSVKKLTGLVNSNTNNISSVLKTLKQKEQLQEYLRLTGRQPVPSKTPYFNKTLRRFFYDETKGFYVVLGTKNGKQIIKRVPGLFFYKNNGFRIVPIRPRKR